MKVSSANSVKVNTLQKNKRLAKGDKSFHTEIESENSNKGISKVDIPKSIAPIEALLSLQEVDEELKKIIFLVDFSEFLTDSSEEAKNTEE